MEPFQRHSLMAGGSRKSEAGWWRKMPLIAWVLLFLLWVLLSGHLDAFHLGTGFLAVALIAWLHSRLPATPEAQAPGLRSLRVPVYGLWLFWQMILSAIYVARVILNPAKHLDPRMIAFRSKQPSLLSQVILANSITLTPGTLTVDLEDDCYLVHAITPSTADDTLNGSMAGRVARLSCDQPLDVAQPEPVALESFSNLK